MADSHYLGRQIFSAPFTHITDTMPRKGVFAHGVALANVEGNTVTVYRQFNDQSTDITVAENMPERFIELLLAEAFTVDSIKGQYLVRHFAWLKNTREKPNHEI